MYSLSESSPATNRTPSAAIPGERAKPDSSILVRAKSIAFWRRARSSSDMGCSFIGGAFLGGVVAGEVFGADRAGDRVEMLHAVNEPGQFVGGDFIGMGIAGLEIGAMPLREIEAGGAGIAWPGVGKPGVEICGARETEA